MTLRSYAEVWPRARAFIRCGGYPSRNSRSPFPKSPFLRSHCGGRCSADGSGPSARNSRRRSSETAARAGISPQYLSEIERGRKEPSSEMIAALAGALGTTLIQLTEQVAGDLRRQQRSPGPGIARRARPGLARRARCCSPSAA